MARCPEKQAGLTRLRLARILSRATVGPIAEREGEISLRGGHVGALGTST